MKIARGLVLLSLSAALFACGSNNHLPYPRATMFPGAEQQKVQSASHWDVLARHESEQILAALGNGNGTITPSLYLGNPARNAGAFQNAWHNMLVSGLVDQGAAVMLSRESALFTVEYDVQVVEHASRERLPLRPGTITAFFAMAAGIDDSQFWEDQGLVLIPIALAGDLWNKFNKDTSAEVTEVIITTRVMDSQQIAHASTRIYYFDADDIAHYRGTGRTFDVVSAGSN